MFKRSVNFSPYEKDQLLQLIREYIVIFEDKRLDGVGRREKERAWLELTDRYNSLESVNLRTSKQLQACWKNLKNRARDITEACKKGAEFPFFAIASKFNSSYLPSTEEDDGYDIKVKAERFSEPEDGEREDFHGMSFLSQSYSISNSPATSTPHDSPTTVTNYVYSPTASLPTVFAPTASLPLPSMSSVPTSSNSVLTPSSKSSSHDNLSDLPSHRVDSIAARLSYSIPSYKTPERSISKSVDRIANSILFERGVAEENHGLFEGRVSDSTASERNGMTDQQGKEAVWEKPSPKSGNVNSLHYKSVPKSSNVPSHATIRKGGNPSRQGSSSKYTSSSGPTMTSVNGHASFVPANRVNKAARYRRLEHQTRMRNLKFERECLETEHKLRCELLQMKIKLCKKKLEVNI